jgi:AraC-like DNA-binding protein
MHLSDKRKFHLKTANRSFMKRSIYGIAQFADYTRPRGIDVEKLLEGSGIHGEDLNDYDRFITHEQEMKILRNLLNLIPDEGLGFEIGKSANISANARVAVPAMFCRNFLEAIVLMFQYIDLSLSHFQYDLFVKNDLALIKMKELFNYGELGRFICELELAAVYSIGNIISGDRLTLKKIDLCYATPTHAGIYEDFFKCPVSFEADENVIFLDSEQLYRPLPMSNPLAREAYERDCKRFKARIDENGSTRERIRQELMASNMNELPSFDRLAKRMNMSTRTLRRRIAAEGTSYKSVISEILQAKAAHLLTHTGLSIEKIAEDLGYSAASNFCQAFKRWTGETPSEYRIKNSRRS